RITILSIAFVIPSRIKEGTSRLLIFTEFQPLFFSAEAICRSTYGKITSRIMFSSFCSATFRFARNFLRWSHVASNLWALPCKAQKTILFLMILQRQMIEDRGQLFG